VSLICILVISKLDFFNELLNRLILSLALSFGERPVNVTPTLRTHVGLVRIPELTTRLKHLSEVSDVKK